MELFLAEPSLVNDYRMTDDLASSNKGKEQFTPEQHKLFSTLVAKNLFTDYKLSPEESQMASEVLWPASGGAEYAKILHYARKGLTKFHWDPGVPLELSLVIHDAMYYHLSNAEWERLALRVGASLMVNGQAALGKRIVEMTAEANWKPPPVEKGFWMFYFQLAMYAVMFSVMIFAAFVSGVWLLVAIGACIVFVAGVASYQVEHPKWKVRREQREAWHYEAALDQIARGAQPKDVFRFDGTLVSQTTEKVMAFSFEPLPDSESPSTGSP